MKILAIVAFWNFSRIVIYLSALLFFGTLFSLFWPSDGIQVDMLLACIGSGTLIVFLLLINHAFVKPAYDKIESDKNKGGAR